MSDDETKEGHLCKNDFPHEHVMDITTASNKGTRVTEIRQTKQIRIPISTIPGIDEIVMDEDLPFKVIVEQELREMVHHFSRPKNDSELLQQTKQKECTCLQGWRGVLATV